MPDKETVIRLIKEEISVCESVNQCYRTIDLPTLRDILALLKQEAVEPKKEDDKKPEPLTVWWYACGYCGKQIDKMDRYCRRCGKQVKWE